MIYFAQTPTGSIKIGYSEDVEARIIQLEREFRGPLSLLNTMPGGIAEEKEIHRRFRHLRLGGTEQFRPAVDLMEFIGRPLLVAANPKTVEAAKKDRIVGLDPDLVAKADMVATRKGLKVGPYLSGLLEATVNRDYVALLKELTELEASK